MPVIYISYEISDIDKKKCDSKNYSMSILCVCVCGWCSDECPGANQMLYVFLGSVSVCL